MKSQKDGKHALKKIAADAAFTGLSVTAISEWTKNKEDNAMGKYGFNENELRKTTTVMVDKDGFHKEVVSYGKPKPAPISAGAAISENGTDATESDITLLVMNVPVNPDPESENPNALVCVLPSDTDDEWEHEIGDTIESLSGYLAATMVFGDVNAALVVDEGLDAGDKVYFQIYATDDDYKVLDRAKIAVEIPGT